MNRHGVLPYVIHFAYELFFDIDEGDVEEHPKISNFVEEIVPRFQDNQFRYHFRMNPQTYDHLLGQVHMVIPHEIKAGQPQILLEKQVLLCIWYTANLESFRSVANRFGISKSTAWETLIRVSEWILEVNRAFQIISWPTNNKALDTINSFQNINGFPGVLGCIDGSHIRILAPNDNPDSYYNRKKFHSVLLQGVCDERKLFIDVFAGIPGSCHDSRLFQMSDLNIAIRQNEVHFPFNSHLIGDLAYPLSKNLIVGFKDFGNLTNRQRNFNKKLSELRIRIEQSFALLKGRFRRLKYMETKRLDLICLIIIVSCILHNTCIFQGEDPNDIMDVQHEIENEGMYRDDMINIGQDVNRLEAIQKRNIIMDMLAL